VFSVFSVVALDGLATNPPRAKAQLQSMRTLVIAASMLFLAGCGTYCATDMHGLDPPGWGSTVPKPHG
jgi:hypothetical protein